MATCDTNSKRLAALQRYLCLLGDLGLVYKYCTIFLMSCLKPFAELVAVGSGRAYAWVASFFFFGLSDPQYSNERFLQYTRVTFGRDT